MYQGFKIEPPFFEIGPKAYLYGKEVLRLARHADQVSKKYRVQIIFTPQYVDIPTLARETENIFIFAQHMDFLPVGRGIGSVLPEAVKAAGAAGVLLNHAEKPLSIDVIKRTIARADEVGLGTMVCADTFENVAAVARLAPNILLAETPELIGRGKRDRKDQEAISKINRIVWDINPDIRVLHGAGISTGEDVYAIIASGAQATGSTSGIIKAPDPFQMLEEMISSVRKAWDITHPSNSGG
jgi:triosephosphate isomerase (TIM)